MADIGVAHLDVVEQGIQRVTYEQLLAAAVDVAGVRHNKLGITHEGEPMALRSKGQNKSMHQIPLRGAGDR